MKTLIIRGTLFIFLLLIPILSVNYYVDSYASFRLTYNKIGKIGMTSNYSVGEEIPISERKPKWARITRMNPVDCMILGSSRSMLFSSETLRLDSFYNLAVSGGNDIYDYMAEVYLLYQYDVLPKRILIEVTPNIFNENFYQRRYMEWGNNADNMRAILDGKVRNKKNSRPLGIQVQDILSLQYFKYNLDQLKKGNRTYIKVHNMFDDEQLYTFHIDGSGAYSRNFINQRDENKISLRIKETCEIKGINGCYGFEELDIEKIKTFEAVISFLLENGVNVSFYLPPYVDEIYDYICNYFTIVLDVENYLLDFAKKKNVQVYGSYNPKYCGITIDDLFCDEYHIKYERVIDTLYPRDERLDSFWIDQIVSERNE